MSATLLAAVLDAQRAQANDIGDTDAIEAWATRLVERTQPH
jgi:hypothetical protein